MTRTNLAAAIRRTADTADMGMDATRMTMYSEGM